MYYALFSVFIVFFYNLMYSFFLCVFWFLFVSEKGEEEQHYPIICTPHHTTKRNGSERKKGRKKDILTSSKAKIGPWSHSKSFHFHLLPTLWKLLFLLLLLLLLLLLVAFFFAPWRLPCRSRETSCLSPPTTRPVTVPSLPASLLLLLLYGDPPLPSPSLNRSIQVWILALLLYKIL